MHVITVATWFAFYATVAVTSFHARYRPISVLHVAIVQAAMVVTLWVPVTQLLWSALANDELEQGAFWAGHWWIWAGLSTLELFCGDEVYNHETNEQKREFEQRRSFRLLTMTWMPLCVVSTLGGALVFQSLARQHAWYALVGWVASVAVHNCTGVAVAHELFHRPPGSLENWCGRIIMTLVSYGQFAVDHVAGHHQHIATPEDTVTARLDENLYSFIIRATTVSYKHSWELEIARLKRSGLPPWHWTNFMIQSAVMSATWAALCWLLAGPSGLLFFVLLSAFSICITEAVDYLEHYGLLRRRTTKEVDGYDGYEPVQPHHSWDSDRLPTSLFLMHLQRHSDHHWKPAKRYQTLDTLVPTRTVPALPTGYAGMLLLTTCPPLWRWVMNPRVPPSMKGLAKEYYGIEVSADEKKTASAVTHVELAGTAAAAAASSTNAPTTTSGSSGTATATTGGSSGSTLVFRGPHATAAAAAHSPGGGGSAAVAAVVAARSPEPPSRRSCSPAAQQPAARAISPAPIGTTRGITAFLSQLLGGRAGV